MDGLRELGEDVWFNLGDRDLALCLARARRLAAGARLTEAVDGAAPHARRARRACCRCADAPVRTWIRSRRAWHGFQEWMIRERAAGPVEDVAYRGAEDAAPSAAVLDALAGARAVDRRAVSNPVISIGPILAVPGLRAALRDSGAPVVAVSPLVGGRSVKGPTEAFLAWAGQPLDERRDRRRTTTGCSTGSWPTSAPTRCRRSRPTWRCPTPPARRRVAQAALEFALALGR